MDKKINSVFEDLKRIDQYESLHESSEIKLTYKEIVTLFKTRMEYLVAEISSLEPNTQERSLVWFEFTVLRRIYDDLLCIPNEIRPWLTDPEQWDAVRDSTLNRYKMVKRKRNDIQ